MTTMLIFGVMLVVVIACTFFFLVGKKQISEEASFAISAICAQSITLEEQITTLANNVKLLCDEVNLLKIENQTLQTQIAALAEDVKHISNNCVVIGE